MTIARAYGRNPIEFQSTLSVRRATVSSLIVSGQIGISIHALRKESDSLFSPQNHAKKHISIHALRKESDRAAGHFCPLSETQASCLALSISNNTTGDNARILAHFRIPALT